VTLARTPWLVAPPTIPPKGIDDENGSAVAAEHPDQD